MSALTPEAARAAAKWLETTRHPMTSSAQELRAEADRLEAAAKTPGQVAFAEWCVDHGGETGIARMDRVAAAVIHHHVGPDRVVVDRADLSTLLYGFDHPNETALGSQPFKRIREVLS